MPLLLALIAPFHLFFLPLQYSYHPHDFSPYRIKPHTFFFQENRQPDFQQAEYAIFHYQGEKNYLLTGLADKSKSIINEK